MFTAELAGYGVVKDPGFTPYPVFIISVQQPMQSWTCYRRYSSFKSLGDHLASTVPGLGGLPQCPHMTDDMLMGDPNQLDRARVLLQQWLHQVLLYNGVKESQVLRNFLCANANMPPPRLEITWAANYCPSLDEMEMDELFDRHLEEKEDGEDSDNEGHSFDDGVDMDQGGGGMSAGGAAAPQMHHGHHHHQNTAPWSDQLDMPDDEDIASSVPIEITFKDPSQLRGMHCQANGAASTAAGTTIPGLRGAAFFPASTAPGNSGGQPMQAPPKVGLDSFRIIKVIGKGSFGKVFLVREKTSATIYAMKVLRKDNIIKRNQVEHTKTERNVLGYVKHPFIVGLNMAFQTREKLFFVLDYCAGGELFFHLGKVGKFTEPRARFYAAEITLALHHVHKLDIIYRDLKPENVLLDGQGHVRLTDFGLSKEGITNNTSGAHSFCGTPEYLAPEILNRQGHGRAVDWWSLGALLYEMLTGLPPFYCKDREKLFEKIRRGSLTYPRYLSEHARDILHGLLTRDPSRRLGSGTEDAEEVKRHQFFAAINWDAVMRLECSPPWEPTVVGSLDTSQFDHEFTSMPIFSPDQHANKMGQSHENVFEGFTFVDRSSHLAGPAPPSALRPRVMVDHLAQPSL